MLIFFIVVLVVIGAALYLFSRQLKRRRRDDFRSGEFEILMHWEYSPEDWDWYAGDPSSRWIKHRDIPGEVFVTPESIYVTNGRDENLFLFDDERRITQCSFFHSFLDLRAESTTDYDGNPLSGHKRGQSTFQHQDFRLYVPQNHQEKGLELAARFKSLAQANSEYAEGFIKGDEVISLFGNSEYSEKSVTDKDDEIISLFGKDDA